MNKIVSFSCFALIAGCILWGSGGCARFSRNGNNLGYEFGQITRGNMERTISASGTLNPVATVKVLSRMNGKVDQIFVDYNDQVKKGDVLAVLNTDTLALQRDQQRSQVLKARANYELQLLNYQNLLILAEKNLISDYELLSAKTSLAIQEADLNSAEASLKVIETEINEYAIITSPIDGIVLERNVNEGETVVENTSSNSSSLFTLAENLREMQIEAAVGEMDISGILQGQEARFTLEALPGRIFMGSVANRYLMPIIQDNVVSYKVIINVENHDGSLLPGMTCAVDFIEERRENVLLAPNAALRFRPSALSENEINDKIFYAGLEGMSDEQRSAAVAARASSTTANRSAPNSAQSGGSAQGGIAGLLTTTGNPGGRNRGAGGNPMVITGPNQQQEAAGSRNAVQAQARPLWYMSQEGKLEVMMVRTGISNGYLTEIIPVRPMRDGQPELVQVRQSLDAPEAEPRTGMAGDLEGMQVVLRERI